MLVVPPLWEGENSHFTFFQASDHNLQRLLISPMSECFSDIHVNPWSVCVYMYRIVSADPPQTPLWKEEREGKKEKRSHKHDSNVNTHTPLSIPSHSQPHAWDLLGGNVIMLRWSFKITCTSPISVWLVASRFRLKKNTWMSLGECMLITMPS